MLRLELAVGLVTVRLKLRVRSPEGELEVAVMVMEPLKVGVLAKVEIVKLRLTGDPKVGFAVLLGEKLQVAPAGRPVQVKVSVPV